MKLETRGQVAQTDKRFSSSAEGLRTPNGDSRGVGSLDTLAHSTQNSSSASESQKAVIEVSESDEEKRYQKRAKRKHITKPLVTRLTDFAKVNDSHLEKSYRNSIYCSDRVIQEDGRLRSSYCKNRCCLVCEAIKTARYIHLYGPEITSWEDPHFVTQTLQTVSADNLKARLSHMQSEWKQTVDKARKSGIEAKAVRKLEITFNTRTGLFHPHYHFLTHNSTFGEYILERHLDRHRESASEKGQDIRQADRRSLVELFKYATKPVSSKRSDEKQAVPLHALDTIYRSLYRKNVISRVGFILKKDIDVEAMDDLVGGNAFRSVEQDIIWEWEQAQADWLDLETGEALSGYVPTD